MCDLFNMSYWKCKQIIQSKWHHLLNTIKSFKFERTRRKINIHLQVFTLNLKNMHFEILMETKNQWLFVFIEWIWEMKGGLRMVSIPFKILIHLYGKFNFFICAYPNRESDTCYGDISCFISNVGLVSMRHMTQSVRWFHVKVLSIVNLIIVLDLYWPFQEYYAEDYVDGLNYAVFQLQDMHNTKLIVVLISLSEENMIW